MTLRAASSARGIESVWDGLVQDCETSVVRNMAPEEVCPAAPSVATKTMKVGWMGILFEALKEREAIDGQKKNDIWKYSHMIVNNVNICVKVK